MSLLNDIAADLNEKRLWPVVALLSAGAVGLPTAASLSSASAPDAGAATPPAMTPVAGAGLAPVLPGLLGHVPARRHVSALEHDPFSATSGHAATATPAATGAPSTGATAGGGATSAARTGPAHSAASSSAPGAGPAPGTPSLSAPSGPVPSFSSPSAVPKLTPVPNLPTPKGVPIPGGVPAPSPGAKRSGGHHAPSPVVAPDPTRYFAVSLRFGAATGSPVLANPPRLQVLPSMQDPVAQYLGVREDGRSAIFLLNPAVSASGDGTCSPNPHSCQLITLHAGDSEFLDAHSASRGTVQYELDLLSVSQHHSSAALAGRARRRESAAGRRMLGASKASALRGLLFSQDLGVVVSRAAHSASSAGARAKASAATTGTARNPAAQSRILTPAPVVPASPAPAPAPASGPPAAAVAPAPAAPSTLLPVGPSPSPAVAPDPAAQMALSLRASWSQASGWMFTR